MKSNYLLPVLMSFSALLFTSKTFSLEHLEIPHPSSPSTASYSETLDDCDGANYQDVDGLVVIEAENLDISGTNWNITTNYGDFTGSGMLTWLGNNNYSSPGNGLISTTIKINTPGTYRFRWRNRIGNGTNSTEHNDSWLRFPDASDFYAEKNGNRIYPKGSGQSPNPNGAGSDGWFKVYLSGTTDWTWSTRTSDNDAHNIFVEFDTAGIYTMEISGRSQFHLIDRTTLSNNASDPLNLNNPETVCAEGSLSVNNPLPNLEKASISLFPNPVEDLINLTINRDTWSRTVSIYDFKGTRILETELNQNNRAIDVSQLSSGFYFLKTNESESKSFIKK